MKTPEKLDTTDRTNSTDSSPAKRLISQIKLPAALSSRPSELDFSEGSSLVKLCSYESEALLDELTELNPEVAHQFSMFAGGIFFEDLGDTGESPVHEAAASFMNDALRGHGTYLGGLVGIGDALKSPNKHFVGDVGVPDVSVQVRPRDSQQLLDPNLLVEVAYAVSLPDTHAKIERYFRRSPGLMAAILIDIEHPWRALPNGMLDYADGKMALYYYERPPHLHGPLVASYAVSFGNNPLTAADVTTARNITRVPQANFRGHGVRAEDPPCDAAGLDLYRVTVPAMHLLVDNSVDPLAGVTIQQLLHFFNGNICAADLSIDLFELKRYVIQDGAYLTNFMISQSLGLDVPPRPVL